MKNLLMRSLALSLGFLATSVRAEDTNWQSVPAMTSNPASSSSVTSMGNPTAVDSAARQALGTAKKPAVTMGKPVVSMAKPIPLPASSDSVKMVSYDQSNPNQNIIRAQSPDISPSIQMPSGNKVANKPTLVSTWVNNSALNSPAPISGPGIISTKPAPTTAAASPGNLLVPSTVVASPLISNATIVGGDCTVNTCEVGGIVDGNCGCACPSYRFYGSAEYLLWWVKGSPVPPLLTTSTGNDGARSGAIGLPGTSVVYGGNSLVSDPRSGARFMAGYWFDDQRIFGFELGGFFLNSETSKFSTISGGSPSLYRPLYNTSTGQSGVEIVATNFPAQLYNVSGGFSSTLKSSFWGGEANLRSNFLCSQNFTIDGLLGFKTLGLNEDLILRESPTFINGSGTQIQDQFKTGNNFYGSQIGVIAEGRYNRWFFEGRAKVGFGVTEQTVQINGGTMALSPGSPSVYYPAGIYAGSTNIGRYNREVFGVVPDIGASVGYQVTDHMRVFVGYDFIYWSNVLRPGQQIDQTINPNLVPGGPGGGPNRPGFNFQSSDFWAQGIKIGMEFRY